MSYGASDPTIRNADVRARKPVEYFANDISSLSSNLDNRGLVICEKKDADGFLIHRSIRHWVKVI